MLEDMPQTRYVKKSSGQKERFSKAKLERSLKFAGAKPGQAHQAADYVGKHLKPRFTTLDIHNAALTYLNKVNPAVASRYNLKQALFRLGPSGYPFEKYMARVLEAYGYEAAVGPIVRGKCVEHEVDILAHKGQEHAIVECKFHNSFANYTDVKVALYMYARFLDLKDRPVRTRQAEKDVIWIITNTRFTREAIRYARCMGVRLTAWKYPGKQSLEHLIEDKGIYPVTVFPSLKKHAVESLVREGVVLAQQVLELSYPQLQKLAQTSPRQAARLKKEAELLFAK